MVRVYSNPDPSVAHLVRNALEQIGVPVILKGDKLGAAMGELPPIAAWAEVWVSPDGREAEIRALVEEVTGAAVVTTPWTCPSCGEEIEGTFGACWSCGADAPAASA